MSDASSAYDWHNRLDGPVGFVGGASFRGQNFFIREAQSQVGRKVLIKEYPGSDKGSAEDLGMAVRRYTLEAYVLGSGYMAQRDRLVTEFEKAGPGLLIHPFWGKFVVTVETKPTIVESWDHGGMAKFTLVVAQVGTLDQPTVTIDTVGSVVSAASGLLAAAQNAFALAFAAAGFAGGVLNAAENAINSVATTLTSVKGQINAALLTVDGVADAITSFSQSVAAIIALPSTIASNLSGLVTQVLGSISNIGAAWNTYFGSNETPGGTVNPSLAPSGSSIVSADARSTFLFNTAMNIITPTQAIPPAKGVGAAPNQINNNLVALQLLTVLSTTASLCQTAVGIPYGSANAATTMLTNILGQIDANMLIVTDDASYTALSDLRASIWRHLTQTAQNLPRVVSYTPPATVPALVLAQRLYGAPDLAEDIIARNKPIDPTMLSGGQALEVLSSG